MAQPKKKVTRSARNMRRSHHALKAPQIQACPKCNEPKVAHRVCPHCGYYKNMEVVKVES
jgi:large subunit ribosomal protein L32